MKKRFLIVGIPIAVVALAVMGCFFILFSTHGKIIEQAKDYEAYSIVSFDEAYSLNAQKIIDGKTGTYATFNITETETKAVLFECPDRYRSLDLKSIDWDGNTYNVIVVSGDVGTIICKSEVWLKTVELPLADEPDSTPHIPEICLGKYFNELEDIAFYNIVGCADGSFLIGMNFTNDWEYTYFRYMPPLTERGTPVLFTRLYWSDDFEVSACDGVTHLSIPMRANEFEDYRFRLEADVNDNGEYWKLINREFVLLDPMDVEMNINAQNITKKLPIPVGEMAKYHGLYADNTWVPDNGTPDDAELAALRTATYGGDSFALMRLYALAASGTDVGADVNAMQIAAVKLTKNEDIVNNISKNPLLKSVNYGAGYRKFPAREALRQAAEAVRVYAESEFRYIDEIEWNTDIERLTSISNYDDFFSYDFDSSDRLWGAWELDFINDGLTDLIYFLLGGTMGNEFWEIIHLDKEGLITSVHSGMEMRSFFMRQIDGYYFFTSWAYDYNDKQSWGLNLFAMKKDGTLWRAEANYKISGMRTVFTDLYDESVRPLYDDLSGKLFDYYNQYKDYGPESIFDRPFEGDNTVNELFRSDGYGHYGLGFMDIDKDSEDEIIGEWMYWPSSAHQIFSYDLRALRSGAEHTFNLGTLLTGQDELLHAFIISYEGKNYFLTMQPFGDSQYIFKLQEISNGTPYMLAAWLVTAEDQVHVTAGEYVDERGW